MDRAGRGVHGTGLLAAGGLALLGHAPVGGHFLTDVLPGGILLGACAVWLRPASFPAELAGAPSAERALIAASGDEGA